MDEKAEPPEGGDILRMCRTCMSIETDVGTMSSLYDDGDSSTRLSEMLATCTGLQMEKTDGLPKKVCKACLECVGNFYHFRCNAERVDEILRKLLTDTSPVLKNENPTVKEEYEYPYTVDINEQTSDSDSELDKPLIKLERTVKLEKTVKKEKKHRIKKDKTYCCTVCQKTFDKPSKLTRHEKVHEKKRADMLMKECNICMKTFKKDCHLKRHMTIHDEVARPFECSVCQRRFRNNSRLLTHMVSHGKQPAHLAEADRSEIDVKIENADTGDANKSEVGKSLHKCSHCEGAFQSYYSLCAHMRKHNKPGRVRACSVCGKVFKKTSHLKRHEHTHEDRRPFKCAQCPRSFAVEAQLEEHLNKHKGIKPHSCPVCAKAFAQRGTLKAHLRVHTRERPYLCPTCGKRFDSSTNLKQHMRRHVGDKAFACSLCPGKFVSKGELKSHMSTHTGARPYVCDTCGGAFTKPNSLVKHKLLHLGVKPHECDVCFIRFICKEHLKRHYRIHTGEKPYKCDVCERAFTQSNDLVKHKRSHLGDNLYKCEQCSQSFRLKTELRNHISEHFISSQVAAGISITIPSDILPKASRNPPATKAEQKTVVLTSSSDGTVLSVEKPLKVNSLKGESLAEHVKNVPTGITVRKVKELTVDVS